MKKPSIRIDEFDKTLYTDNTFLTKDKVFSFLPSDVVVGATGASLQSILGFSSTAKFALIGEPGQGESEIVSLSNATLPENKTIYFSSGITFNHPQDTKVYCIDWNQMAFSRSTGLTSQKSTLTTVGITINQPETLYRDATNTTGYGWVELKESKGSTFSTASDAVPYTGYADNTVFKIKKRALDNCNEQIGELITHEYLNESLWEARREYHKAKGKRPFRRVYEADLGNVSTGINKIALPTDVEKPYTAENVYKVRIGTEEPCSYYDKKDWDNDYDGVAHTTLAVAYTKTTDQDLWCDSVRDLEDSGSVMIEGDTVAYSAKGVSGGTLRISTHGSYSHAIYSDVWQGIDDGLPQNFTVWMNTDGTAYIYFSCPIETAYVDQNIWGDYYRTLVTYDSDADELDEPEYDMFVPYLEYKIKKRKNKGLQPLEDPSYIEWLKRKQNALDNEYLGTEIRLVPDIEELP